MWFPSDSWGKFTMTVDGQKIGEIQELSITKPSARIKKEVHEMPVLNPKTQEMDHADLSIVHRIIPESVLLRSLADMKSPIETARIELSHNELHNQVMFTLKLGEISAKTEVSTQSFEEMIAHAYYNGKKIDHVSEFKDTVDRLVDQFIQDHANDFYIRSGIIHSFKQGIGIITDDKTGQEVGTFESIYMQVDKNPANQNATIEHIHLSTRTMKDLTDAPNRFTYRFFSLEDDTIYKLIPQALAIDSSENDLKLESLLASNYLIGAETFVKNHEKRDIIAKANVTKALVADLDPNDQLFTLHYGQFIETRNEILQESQKAEKKQKLVSKYSDLDLDL